MSIRLRKKKIKGGRFSLYLDIYQDGKREYEFLKLYLGKDKERNKEIMELAENIRAKKHLAVTSDKYGFIPKFKRKASFVEYFENLTKEKKFASNYKNTLKHLKMYTGGNLKFSQINEKWCEDFRKYLSGIVAQNSVCTYLSTLKTALNRAVKKDKILTENPIRYVENINKIETERIYLTYNELVKLANTKCINDDIKRAFLFACFTGLRFSDLGNLTWEMIHFDGKRYKLAFRQKKTRGYEYFPLPETAIKLLFNNQDNIINLPHNRVFKVHDLNWYNKVLKKWAREAGINKHMSSHVGRHTFATLALSQGVDIYTVSKLLGHKSLNHTQIYAKIIDEKKNEAVDLLPKIEVI